MINSVFVSSIVRTNDSNLEKIFFTQGRIYTFLNPVSYLDALNNKGYFSQFDGIFADGSILVGAIRLLYRRKVKRRSFDMTSIAPLLFEFAEKNSKSIYIVASEQEKVEKTVKVFRERYPAIRIIGYRNGYFKSEEEKDEESRYISKLNPDFLIVGMGILTQEKFLLKVKKAGFQGIGFTCGGFIHQTARDQIDYYPSWIDKYNLRFLYRMYKEPHTRKRYIKAGFLFPWKFVWERFFG